MMRETTGWKVAVSHAACIFLSGGHMHPTTQVDRPTTRPPRSFFTTTPEDLIKDGLYKDIALALMRDEHRAVSMALLAKKLGATRRSKHPSLYFHTRSAITSDRSQSA